jgi:hypothetical protein
VVPLSVTRPGTKCDGQLIEGTEHDIIHVNVIVPDDCIWLQFIRYSIKCKDEDGTEITYELALRYQIHSPTLDLVMCTKGRCRQPLDPVLGICECPQVLALYLHPDIAVIRTVECDAGTLTALEFGHFAIQAIKRFRVPLECN